MVLPSLDKFVQDYCILGVAQSTHKSYTSAYKRFHEFCIEYDITSPLPVTESSLCYFAAFLAIKGLAPASIKVYLAAVRHMQVIQGFPEPRVTSSLPRLRLVLNGIARSRVLGQQTKQKPRLPITTPVLKKLFSTLAERPPTHDNFLLWAACPICFFGFFRAGEITTPSRTGYQPSRHLAWGDVSVDNYAEPSLLRIYLKVRVEV